jgi:hypothetical protein
MVGTYQDSEGGGERHGSPPSINGSHSCRGSGLKVDRGRRRLSVGRRRGPPRETSCSIGEPLALRPHEREIGANLLVTAIILWNTRYLNRAITALQVEDVPDQLLVHLSPLGWEHVNLTGDYIWAPADQLAENRDGFRPLRPAPALLAA